MPSMWGEVEGKEEINVPRKESELSSQAPQRAHTCGESCEVWCSVLGAQGLRASASLLLQGREPGPRSPQPRGTWAGSCACKGAWPKAQEESG